MNLSVAIRADMGRRVLKIDFASDAARDNGAFDLLIQAATALRAVTA